MEKGQSHAAVGGPADKLCLCLVQGEAGGDRPDLFGRVGVAEHHLQPPGGFHLAPDRLQLDHPIQHVRRLAEVLDRFEERDDLDLG